jgi:GST-like protein
MNNRLYDRPYLAGDDYTVADMICLPWTVNYKLAGIDLDEFRYFKRWFEELNARPAVIAGLAVTAGVAPEDPATVSPEEQARRRALLYNQRARPAPVA